MKKIFILLVLLALPGSAAVYDKAGTSGAQYLKLSKSAKSIGMGEAYAAVTGELGQIYYNPAGVYSSFNLTFNMLYTRYIGRENFFNLSGKYKLPGEGGDIAIALSTMISSQKQTDYDGITVSRTEQEFRNNSFMAILNYSRLFQDHIYGGMNLKILNDSYAGDYSDFNFSIDIGGILDFGIINGKLDRFNLGISVMNLGTKTGVDVLSFLQPITFRSGLSYSWLINEKNELLSAMDFEKVRDRGLKFNMGLQYTLIKAIIFRFGYKVGDRLNGFKFGGGFRLKSYTMDYALDWGDLGLNHRVEIGFEFPARGADQIQARNLDKLYFFGIAAFNSGDYGNSRKFFELILRIDPDYSRAVARLEEIKVLENKDRKLKILREAMIELE